MDKWHPFNIRALIKESKGWGKRVEKLKRDIANARSLKSVNNESGIRSTDISNPTENTAIDIVDRLQAELDEIYKDKEKLDYALSALSKEDRAFVKEMYFTNRVNSVVVWEYGRAHGVNKDIVYRRLNKMLDDMAKAVDEKYYRAE